VSEPWDRSGEPVHVLESDDDGVSPPVRLKRSSIGAIEAEQSVGALHLTVCELLGGDPVHLNQGRRRSPRVDHAQLPGRVPQGLGASLKVDGVDVLEDAFADEASATVGLFMFDDNLNGMTCSCRPLGHVSWRSSTTASRCGSRAGRRRLTLAVFE